MNKRRLSLSATIILLLTTLVSGVLARQITKIEYITKYQDAPILEKYSNGISIVYENDKGKLTSANLYFADMSDELKSYLGCGTDSAKSINTPKLQIPYTEEIGNYLNGYLLVLKESKKADDRRDSLLLKLQKGEVSIKDKQWLIANDKNYKDIIAEYNLLRNRPLPTGLGDIGKLIREFCDGEIELYSLENELTQQNISRENYDRIKPKLEKLTTKLLALSTKIIKKIDSNFGEYRLQTLGQNKNLKKSEIISQDYLAISLLQQYVRFLNEKSPDKINDFILSYRKVAPLMKYKTEKFLKEKSDFKLTAVYVDAYDKDSISGTFVYRCKFINPNLIVDNRGITITKFYIINYDGKWVIYKLYPFTREDGPKGLDHFNKALLLEKSSNQKYKTDNLSNYKT